MRFFGRDEWGESGDLMGGWAHFDVALSLSIEDFGLPDAEKLPSRQQIMYGIGRLTIRTGATTST